MDKEKKSGSAESKGNSQIIKFFALLFHSVKSIVLMSVAVVLAVVSREVEGAYGYKITQDVRQVIELSESTLYPVLRRLQKDECLEVYDRECAGRNRRYYKTTEKGRLQLNLYESEWRKYSAKINGIFEGGTGK